MQLKQLEDFVSIPIRYGNYFAKAVDKHFRYIGSSRTAPTADGTQDITILRADQIGDAVYISFSRLYNTYDDADVAIGDAQLYLLYAYGPMADDSLSYHTAKYVSSAICLSDICGTHDF